MLSSNQLKELLMTPEEYSSLAHKTPYIYEIKNNNKELYYFGTYHSRDPEDEIFNIIESAIKEFNPEVLLIEGHTFVNELLAEELKNKIYRNRNNISAIIEEFGEPIFSLIKANENKADTYSADINHQDEIKYLFENGFSNDEIFFFFCIHYLPTWKYKSSDERLVRLEAAIERFCLGNE
ncbi:MAG: hypothetical protein Q9M76_00935 [Candidatus Dojkabacteria bacterium]|nr:hypothetical protein [Candidatus Dojkabacteria bacterium]